MPGVQRDWLAAGVSQKEIDHQIARADPSPQMIAIDTGPYPHRERDVLEDTEGYTLFVNPRGGRMKLAKGADGVPIGEYPMPVEFSVRSETDWPRIKERYRWAAGRLQHGWAEGARAAQEAGLPIRIDFDGYYWFIRSLMGDEAACLAFYDAPALVHDMCQTLSQLTLDCADQLEQAGVIPDTVHFPEDIAGKSGSIVGPRQFREFFMPYWREVTDRFQRMGVPHLEVDSDGNVWDLIPLYLAAGINGLMPFEVQAGMDVVEVRRRYPRELVITGGMNKLAFVQGRASIDRMLDHVLPPMMERGGGYVIMFDHRLTRGGAFGDFVYFVDRVRAYLGLQE